MGWNGSGSVNRSDGTRTGTQVWQQARDAGEKILAADHDTHDQDLADAIEKCLNRDGENAVAANISWGGFKVTSLGDGTARSDAMNVGQLQDADVIWGGTAGGTANALTLSLSPAITAYGSGGLRLRFVAGASTNTGAATLNVNSVGARSITDRAGNALTGGEIPPDSLVEVVDDGTNFRLASVVEAGGAVTLRSTDAGAAAGPIFTLHRDSASPADDDIIGRMNFDGEDDGGNQTTYAAIEGQLVDVTGATEDGRLRFYNMKAGSEFEIFRLETETATLFSDDAGAVTSPILKLYRNSASPADSDNLGRLEFNGNNSAAEETTFARMFGTIEDATDGTEDGSLSLQATTNGSANTTKLKLGPTESLFAGINDQTTGSSANVFVNSSTGALARSTSSRRYKRDIQGYERGLADLMQLSPVRYRGTGKIDGDKEFAGFTAEDVHDLGMTEYVVYDDEGRPDALNYPQMVALLVNAVKELNARVETLERSARA